MKKEIFKKVDGKMTYEGKVLSLYDEKDTGKFWWKVPKEIIENLNRKSFGMKYDLFNNAEEGHEWVIEPKESLPVRTITGEKSKVKTNPEHWSNYLSEEDKKIYEELERKGTEARKKVYEESKIQREKEKLEAKIKELQEQLSKMDE